MLATVAAAPVVATSSANASVLPTSGTAATCNAEALGACATISGITSAGDAAVGDTLHCGYHLASSYSLFGRPGNVLYTWKRSLSGGGYQVWDKGPTISVRPDMLGWDIACFVTVPTGVNSVREGNSENVNIIQGSFTNSVAPSVKGVVSAGVVVPGHQLTAEAGTWSDPNSRSLSYAWKSGSNVLSTSTRYTPTASQIGKTVTLYVTAKRKAFTSKTVAAKSVVVKGVLGNSSAPTISKGTCNTVALTCAPLTGSLGSWTKGTTLKFQWLLNGSVVSGAKSLTYKPAFSAYGHTLQLRVTATKANYISKVATSTFYVIGIQSQQ
jgi:hypothetical protein